MPIHYLAGPGLAQAGQAAAPIDAAVRRQQELSLRTQAQNRAFTLREAQAQARLQDRQREEMSTRLRTLQRGLSQSLNIAQELGLDTDFAAFESMQAELERRDPEMSAQVRSIFGTPTSDTGLDYPTAFNAVGKALLNVRGRDSLISKEQQAREFAEEAEASEYSEEQLIRIQSAALDPNVTPAEMQLEIEEERGRARAMVTRRREVEYGRDTAASLAREFPGPLADSRAAQDYMARLLTGQSRSIRKDLGLLRMILQDGEGVVGEIEADAFNLHALTGRPQAEGGPDSQSPGGPPRPTGGPQPTIAQFDGSLPADPPLRPRPTGGPQPEIAQMDGALPPPPEVSTSPGDATFEALVPEANAGKAAVVTEFPAWAEANGFDLADKEDVEKAIAAYRAELAKRDAARERNRAAIDKAQAGLMNLGPFSQ